MAHSAITDPFSPFGAAAKTKLLLLGSPDFGLELMNRARSLHIEHVSPAGLWRREISRSPSASGGAAEIAILALLRRWFFARKPDAGFVLTDFPATLLQAQVFDEWLEARSESLDGVFADPAAAPSVVGHYRTLGLLSGAGAFAA